MDRNELADKLEAIVSMWPILGNHARATVKKAAAALRESEEWRRDAERYRWLRDLPLGSPHESIGNMPGDMWDAAIDAARKEGV